MPNAAGDGDTVIPAERIASILSSAPPLPPGAPSIRGGPPGPASMSYLFSVAADSGGSSDLGNFGAAAERSLAERKAAHEERERRAREQSSDDDSDASI